jgi:hypothetical protein
MAESLVLLLHIDQLASLFASAQVQVGTWQFTEEFSSDFQHIRQACLEFLGWMRVSKLFEAHRTGFEAALRKATKGFLDVRDRMENERLHTNQMSSSVTLAEELNPFASSVQKGGQRLYDIDFFHHRWREEGLHVDSLESDTCRCCSVSRCVFHQQSVTGLILGQWHSGGLHNSIGDPVQNSPFLSLEQVYSAVQ